MLVPAPLHYHPDHRLPEGSVLSLAADADRTLWIGTSAGLVRFVDGQFIPTRLTDGPAPAVYSLLVGEDGDLWVGAVSGLYRRSGARSERVAIPQTSTAVVRALLRDDDTGALWVGTDSGLHRRDNDARWQRLGVSDGLPSQRIRALAQDRQGRVWTATTAGIALCAGDDVTRIGPPLLPDGPFTSLLVDGSGHVWIGSLADGAWRFDGTGYRHLSARDGLPGSAVWDLFPGPEGTVWVATDHGLAVYGSLEGAQQ